MGQVIREACADCHGEGRIRQEKILGLKIPPGVDDGTRLRVSGEGEAGSHGGPTGDLYVVLKVHEHPFFERQGNDLYCTIPVSLTQAALGADLKVPTLDAKSERLRIPEGTQSGSVFRLRGRGVPSLDGHGQGDIYVSIQVMIPTRLSREQKRVLELLGNAIRVDNKPLERRDIPKLVKGIGAYEGERTTAIALGLLMLTFVRPQELRGAEWDAFDVVAAQWRIPGT